MDPQQKESKVTSTIKSQEIRERPARARKKLISSHEAPERSEEHESAAEMQNFWSTIAFSAALSLTFLIKPLYERLFIHKPRVIIIGDVHGCLDELKELLEKLNYNPTMDKLYCTGDLVNKGPYSAEVIRFCREMNIKCVKGNHDEYAITHFLSNNMTNTVVDIEYMTKLTKDELEWYKNLPYIIEIPEYNVILVHAGIQQGIPLDKQNPYHLIYMRNILEDGNPISGIHKGVPWASTWRGPQHVVFGHDARRGLQQYEYATGLDTGCCYGKELTALVLPSWKIVSVKAKRMYTVPDDSSQKF